MNTSSTLIPTGLVLKFSVVGCSLRYRRCRGSRSLERTLGKGVDSFFRDLYHIDAISVNVEPCAVEQESEVLRKVENRRDEGQAA